jgi:hypothetical protein
LNHQNNLWKSSPTLLLQRREFEYSPFCKGGLRGIFMPLALWHVAR